MEYRQHDDIFRGAGRGLTLPCHSASLCICCLAFYDLHTVGYIQVLLAQERFSARGSLCLQASRKGLLLFGEKVAGGEYSVACI